jgi:phospholipid/cholesterol/gamma-HCH transport system permease protein
MTGMVEQLGARILYASDATGDCLVLLAQCLRECTKVFAHPRRILEQMLRAGYETWIISSGIGLFMGMILGFHLGETLSNLNMEESISAVVAYSMIKELGPVITALVLAGRVGAAIAAEVGTMQINEEVDALHTLGISPVRYLAMPRFVACTTMLPILVISASVIGIIGGGLVAHEYYEIGWKVYFDNVWDVLEARDVIEGVVKAGLFGGIVSIIACQRGFRTRGGAEGVGRAITSAVVASFVCIIICDLIVTRIML